MPTALIVDDDGDTLAALADLAEERGFDTATAGSLEAARTEIRRRPPDLAILDMVLPDGSALDILVEFARPEELRILLVSGQPEIDAALRRMSFRSIEYERKPIDPARFRARLDDAFREIVRRRPEQEPVDRSDFENLIGASRGMRRVFDLVEKVAPTDSTVLISGESGTGKELIARAIHARSARATSPFVALNCGAIAETLIDSELFGHERGAFTGARNRRPGLFEEASGGTLLLDEIAEMNTDLQVRLLRVLETGVTRRVGGNEDIPVDCRVLAATNRDFEAAIREGRLREDLYYRLAVVAVELPPLRSREGDVDLLAERFLSELNERHGRERRFAPATLAALRSYHWPGNVRQLRHAVERAHVLAAGNRIEVQDLPRHVTGGTATTDETLHLPVGTPIAEAERRLILATLERYGGNREKTAEALGISVRTLYNRLRSYEDEADDGGEG